VEAGLHGAITQKTAIFLFSAVELWVPLICKRSIKYWMSMKPKNYWVERKVFAFSKGWRKHKLPRSFYKAGIEKLVTRWETVIASNGNYIID
jgi:hypothetical protein